MNLIFVIILMYKRYIEGVSHKNLTNPTDGSSDMQDKNIMIFFGTPFVCLMY